MRPELVLSLDGDNFPVSGACSVCGDSMPLRDPSTSNSHDQIAYQSQQFKLHLEKQHLRDSSTLTRELLETSVIRVSGFSNF